jgi:hypothetical protein
MGTTITNRIEVHDEKRGINSGNAHYYLVKKLLPHICFLKH